jgi:hypothetical protein
MEKMVPQDPMAAPVATDRPVRDHDKQLHPKHAKLVPMHQPDPQATLDLAVPQDLQVLPEPHPMAEAADHPAQPAQQAHPVNQVHPETRVNQVFPVKSSNNPDKSDHQDLAVNLVHPETTVAMVLLVSQVAMVPQDRTAIVVVQVATAKTVPPVDRAHKANAARQVPAITAHHRAQHPDTNKRSVYAVKQHCQSHRCQRIVDIAMVGCWDDIMLSQPPLLYYFRFAFLLLTVLAMSSSSEYHLEKSTF